MNLGKTSEKAKGIRFLLVPYLLIAPTFILLVLITIYPFLYSLYMSFTSLDLRFGMGYHFVGIRNYIQILFDPFFLLSLKNSVYYIIGSTGLTLSLGLGLALVVNRLPKGVAKFKIILLLPMLMAPVVIGLLWKWMVNPLYGLLNYFFVLVGIPEQAWLGTVSTASTVVVMVDVWQWTPFVYLIALAGLQSIPCEPYEAAELDGASSWQIFANITLPLLRPVMIVALLFRIIDTFRLFDIIYPMTLGGPAYSTESISFYIYRQGFIFNKIAHACAASYIILPVVILITQMSLRFLYKEE